MFRLLTPSSVRTLCVDTLCTDTLVTSLTDIVDCSMAPYSQHGSEPNRLLTDDDKAILPLTTRQETTR